MKSIFKKLFFAITLIFSFNIIWAQITVNPNDYFYQQAQIWEIRGLISELPPLRPYSFTKINEILTGVIENELSNEKDIFIAKNYYEELNNKKWNVEIDNDFSLATNNQNDNKIQKFYGLYPSFNGDLSFYDGIISLGYKIGFTNRIGELGSFLPIYATEKQNTTFDVALLGPFTSCLDTDSVVSIGNSKLFFQGGINRSGYGHFFGDGLALSENSTHAGNLGFTFLGNNFSYAQQFSIIGASRSFNGGGLAPNKYYSFHQISVDLLKYFTFSYYETIVFGQRLDLSYMLPVVYMAAQGLGGYDDNLQMGIALKYKPINQLQFAIDGIVDDVDVNKFIKNLSLQGRYRFGMKLGGIYTPDNLFFTKMDLNYTLITPYTYSHYQGNGGSDTIIPYGFNYQDCTNSGKHLGTIYDPNSDAINFTMDFNPLNRFYIKFNTSFVRHGNVCENYTADEIIKFLQAPYGTYSTDGSIFTHQIFNGAQNVLPTAQNFLNLLNQDHIMKAFKTGLDLEYSLPKFWKSARVSFCMNYTLQYIHNKGVSSTMYPGDQLVYQLSGEYEGYYLWVVNNKYYSEDELTENAENIADYYKNLWISNLQNVLNNFISFGITIKY